MMLIKNPKVIVLYKDNHAIIRHFTYKKMFKKTYVYDITFINGTSYFSNNKDSFIELLRNKPYFKEYYRQKLVTSFIKETRKRGL